MPNRGGKLPHVYQDNQLTVKTMVVTTLNLPISEDGKLMKMILNYVMI